MVKRAEHTGTAHHTKLGDLWVKPQNKSTYDIEEQRNVLKSHDSKVHVITVCGNAQLT